MIELEYHHFATPSKLINLASGHQWLVTFHKEKKLDTIHLLIEIHPPINQSCTRTPPRPTKPLDLQI